MRPIHLLRSNRQPVPSDFDVVVNELRRWSQAGVVIRDADQVSDDPHALFLCWDGESPDWVSALNPTDRERVLRRMVYLNGFLKAPLMLEALEASKVAGGVAGFSMETTRLALPVNQFLAGHRSIVARLDATPVEAFASEHYCYYRTPEPRPIAKGIIEFLEAMSEAEDETNRDANAV